MHSFGAGRALTHVLFGIQCHCKWSTLSMRPRTSWCYSFSCRIARTRLPWSNEGTTRFIRLANRFRQISRATALRPRLPVVVAWGVALLHAACAKARCVPSAKGRARRQQVWCSASGVRFRPVVSLFRTESLLRLWKLIPQMTPFLMTRQAAACPARRIRRAAACPARRIQARRPMARRAAVGLARRMQAPSWRPAHA